MKNQITDIQKKHRDKRDKNDKHDKSDIHDKYVEYDNSDKRDRVIWKKMKSAIIIVMKFLFEEFVCKIF